MNPADLPQIGLSSSDLSLLTLFPAGALDRQDGDDRASWSARSGYWAIAIEKTLLHMRMRKAHGTASSRPSGPASRWRELYRSLSARPTALDGGPVRGRDAGMEAQPGGRGALVRRPADCGSAR